MKIMVKRLVLLSLLGLVVVACRSTPTPGVFEVLPTDTPVPPATPTATPTLAALTETSYIEPARKQIFSDLVDAQNRGIGDDEAYEKVAQGWYITADAVKAIEAEGIEKGWLLPTATATPIPAPPTPTLTPILVAKPAFEVKKVRYAWSIYGKTCVRAAVVIRNKGTHTVWLSDITFTVYDVNGKVLEVLPAWWIVPRIIRAGEAAYANAEAMEDLEDLEPSRVGELKVNFDYVLTDEEPQLLTVENFSGEESFIGYDVLGEVVNTSGESAGEIHVAVALYDKNNNLLDVLDTHLSTTLASGDRMGFRAGSSCGVSPEVWKQVKRFEGVAHNLKWQW